jgi:outer membrane receptor protein involved in Fe transport
MITPFFALFIMTGITGKIQGVVMDQNTDEPIPYTNILVVNTEIGAATDDNGNFFILNVPPGRYTIEVSCLGYQTKIIKDVIVEIDQSTRLDISLRQTPIEIEPITVTSERPVVKKDMVGTTYIVRKSELAYLPVDYTINLVTFQPSVAHMDTAIHVRGGRAHEVLYLIDNVSIIDPQTGDLAINLSKAIVDEVIFLPGGFDVEYGRAMSGVINMVTSHPSDKLQGTMYGKTETLMPFYYDFGYENVRSSFHIPISRRFKGIVSLDIMHTDDWDPKLYILPHKQRDDYSLYGKWIYAPSGKLNFSVSGAQSRTQFGRYNTLWKFYLDHYRSDMRTGNLQIFNMSYLPNSRNLFNVTISRLYTTRTYGVREPGSYGPFENFIFRDYTTLTWPRSSIRNPFGVDLFWIPGEGDYPEYQNKSSLVMKAHVNATLQFHENHEVKAGGEYAYMDFGNFSYFVHDTIFQIIDEYQYKPKEYSLFVQDNVDYKGLYAKIGCRYDYFSSGIEGIEPRTVISPRFGFSFMVTDKFLFRTNIGRYAQPPLYDHMYEYYNLLPLPSYIGVSNWLPLIGNPDLGPEKTTSYEIGLQGEIKKNLIATINTFYKEIFDLVGTRYIPPHIVTYDFVSYLNVEYANVKGIEAILEFTTSVFTGKLSYTISWARGTSSYAEEVYYRYYHENPDTSIVPPATEYYLDFDQRHRIFVQGIVQLPLQTQLYLFGYFGNGFPYTPPGPEGKYEERNINLHPNQRQIDCVISKSLTVGTVSLTVDLEIIDLLDARYEVAQHYPLLGTINPDDFNSYISLTSSYYSPAADINHDGLITPYEEYKAYYLLNEASDDWVNAFTSPRRARIGISVCFKRS